MYILETLVNLPPENSLRKSFDWYIVPVVNPDGYEYSHTTNRLWRKSRSASKVTATHLDVAPSFLGVLWEFLRSPFGISRSEMAYNSCDNFQDML